jgi:hypothetical protein
MSVSFRTVFARLSGVAGCWESVVRRNSLPARMACWPLIANTSWAVGSVPRSRAELALIALCTFSCAAHTCAFASAICWPVYVGGGGGLGCTGRNQPTTATTSVTTSAVMRNENIGQCRMRGFGIATGQGGGTGRGGGKSDTGSILSSTAHTGSHP